MSTEGLNKEEVDAIVKYKEAKTMPMTYDQLPTKLVYRNREETGRSHQSTPISHNGQRKLALGEIDFLTEYAKTNGTVVLYIGSAPGDHIPLIATLLPTVEFVLYDPRSFNADVFTCKNVSVFKQLFLDKDCEIFRGSKVMETCENLLFISDIRTWESGTIPTEENVETDMSLQRRILESIKPDHSYLKFRLPYVTPETGSKTYNYLKGTIALQSWAPKGSTETRLVVSKKSDGSFATHSYKIKEYDNKLYYHKLVEREYGTYPSLMFPGTQYCLCYECFTEQKTLERFAKLLYQDDVGNAGYLYIYMMLNKYTGETENKKMERHYKKLKTINIVEWPE